MDEPVGGGQTARTAAGRLADSQCQRPLAIHGAEQSVNAETLDCLVNTFGLLFLQVQRPTLFINHGTS